jgi:pyridinium-3,5-biscarboxylic acid mononucleotide sulfurtransferase
VNKKFSDLKNYFRRWPRAALLFSGGLDSSLLLAVGARALGDGLTAITFTGPHTAPGELAAACALARRFRVRHLVRKFDPLILPQFRENTRERCYVCKRAVIEQGWQLAAGVPALWDGTNLDDLADFRPGRQAARELGVVSPLLEAGLGKAAIRDLSRALGLDWDKPPQSCLATRFPYGAILTREDLARVGQGEAWLRRRGFRHVRLRRQGGGVRLELPPGEWPAFLAPQVRGPFGVLVNRLGFGPLSLDLPR